ncbi:general substrate transporter [Aspergillus costaricaensis CBS 115574]|uniref:General substrate transporter n=1 Tax=Aspergillus costaricaensis CBS 115574 TaxID=1448317 RepID=A0ACD1IVK1_9EURO|nr:general substrate transporter [Aspergillus costaricaensis CBS 115574]RAK93772.1 general substrate transporter [Aspergillus costaricaensis CBS 115574]
MSVVDGKSLMRVITLAGATGFLLFGYDQGVLSGLNTAEDFLDTFDGPSPSLLGTINAIYEIGYFVGAVNVFFVGEKLGRKRCMYLGAALMLVGAVLQASAYGTPQMIIGRIVCGWGNGFNTAVTPLWVSELSPAKSRGRLVSVEGNLIAGGIVVAYFFNIGMSYLPPSNPVEWRVPIAFQGVFIIAQVLLVYVLPESPRWLTKYGRHDEALDILAQLSSRSDTIESPAARALKAEIDRALALEAADGPWRIREVFASGPLKIGRRYLLACGLQIMQQLSGVNILVYYFPHILTTDLAYADRTALYISASLALTYWVFSLIPVFSLDQMSRRKPLIWGSVICSLSFLLVSILSIVVGAIPSQTSKQGVGVVHPLTMQVKAGVLQQDPTTAKTKASLTWFFVFEAAFGFGWVPIPWLYAPEIMPMRHRSHCAALSTASNWIFNYMIVQITPVAIANIRWKTSSYEGTSLKPGPIRE